MTVPRPQVSSGGGGGGGGGARGVTVTVNESTTDPDTHYRSSDHESRDLLHRNPVARSKSDRAQDTFQRDLSRTLDQYRDENIRPHHHHHPGYGHI